MSRSKATPESIAKSMNTLKQIWKPDAPIGHEGMTAAELKVQREALRTSLQRMEAIKVACTHCQQFDLGACRTHGEIPAEFQKIEGECPDWRYDAIPF